MPQAGGPQELALSYYAVVLRRRWWVPVLGALLGLALSAAALAAVPLTTTATSVVRVNVITNDPFNPSRTPSALLDMNGEAQLAGSHLVAERATTELGSDFTATEIREAADATVVPDTAVIRITATAEDETRARAIADAVAQSYLTTRSEQAQGRIDRQVAQSRERLGALREELAILNARLATAEPNSEEALQAETDRSLIVAEINSVLAQQASTQSIDTTGGAVLNPAAVGSIQREPSTSLILATGLLGGLGAGLAAAFVVQAMAARVRQPSDVRRHTGHPVMGEVPGHRLSLPMGASALDEISVVRERLLAEPALASGKGMLAVFGAPGTTLEALGSTAIELAEQLARAGVDVLLTPLAMGGSDEEAFGAMLPLQRLMLAPTGERRYSGGPGGRLTVLLPPQGAVGGDESDGRGFHERLALEARDRLVVGVVSSSASTAARLAACRLTRAAVLLVTRGHTRVHDLQKWVHDLREMGGQPLGSVLLPGLDERRIRGKSRRSGHAAERRIEALPPQAIEPVSSHHQPSDVSR